MQKIILVALLLCLLFTACSNTPDSDSFSMSQPASQSTQTEQPDTKVTVSSQKKPNTVKPSMTEEDYANILFAVVSEDYLMGRSLMRADDQELFGDTCAVFMVGTNTAEKFTTEDFLAVSRTGTVYRYNVISDEWSKYQATPSIDTVAIDNCIYMLNEYLRDEFAVEYRDMPSEVKQAIFEDESHTDGLPDKLIGETEEIPDGYFPDPLARSFYPVYSMASYDEVIAYFREYFSQSYMEEIEFMLSYEFTEFDGVLYLVRAGRGYGAVTLDFDSIDISNFAIDNTVLVDQLLFGQKDATLKVTFDTTGGALKICNVDRL